MPIISLTEVEALLDGASLDVKEGLRHVRTESGVERFHEPIGSPIGIHSVESDFQGWDKFKGSDGKDYYVGKHGAGFVATDANDKVIASGKTKDDATAALNQHVLGKTPAARKAPVPVKRTTPRTRRAPISRSGTGGGKPLVSPEGTALGGMHVASDDERAKLKANKKLVIPPAWTDVQIADDLDTAALLARGRDEAGRIQSIYSAEHTKNQAAAKYERNKRLHAVIDKLDKALEQDAMHDDTAACVLLIRTMGIRNGSTSKTGAKVQAFGASTLEARHIKQYPGTNRTSFDFTGKKGVRIQLTTRNEELFNVLQKQLEGKTGRDKVFATTSAKTNAYLDARLGNEFKIHDLRTLKANTIALGIVSKTRSKPKTKTEFNRMRLSVGQAVSEALGNNRSEALKSYINPSVFAPWWNPEWGDQPS